MLYGLQDARQTGYLCASLPCLCGAIRRWICRPHKVLGAVLGTSLFLLAVHIASGAIFTPSTPAKPGYEIAVPETPATRGAPAAPAEVPIESMLPGGSLNRAKQTSGCAKPAIPSRRARPAMSARIFTKLSDARSPPCWLQLLGGVEGKGRRVDLRCAQYLAEEPPR